MMYALIPVCLCLMVVFLMKESKNLPHARGDEPSRFSSASAPLSICPTHVGMNRTKNS